MADEKVQSERPEDDDMSVRIPVGNVPTPLLDKVHEPITRFERVIDHLGRLLIGR